MPGGARPKLANVASPSPAGPPPLPEVEADGRGGPTTTAEPVPAKSGEPSPAGMAAIVPPGPASTRTAVQILPLIVGAIIVLTLVLPWYSGPSGLSSPQDDSPRAALLMSWDMIRESPVGFAVFLIGAWLIGLAAIVLGAAIRGLPSAICFTSLGSVGGLLLLMAFLASSDFRGQSGAGGELAWLLPLAIGGLLLRLANIVTVHLRLRYGSPRLIRILQMVFGGLLTLIVAVNIIGFLAEAEAPAGDTALLLLAGLAILIGCVLTLIDGILPERSPLLAESSLLLLYGATMGQMGYIVVRPTLTVGYAGAAWPFANMVILSGALAVLTGYGIYRMSCNLLGAPGGAASRATEMVGDPQLETARALTP